MTKQLITIDEIDVPALFGDDDKAEKLLAVVGEAVNSIVVDPETLKGRKEIASIAAKIPRLKTSIDGVGKDMVADIKAKARAIDSRRKTLRDGLDEIRTTFRQPLTDFEEKEKARVRGLEVAITSLDATLHMIQISYELVGLEKFYKDAQSLLDRDWAEYKVKSTELAEQINAAYETKKAQIEEAKRLEEENARLIKEAEERAQKEREDRIARDAADNARREEERKRILAESKAKAEREAEQQRMRDAEEAKLQAERDAIEAQRREIEQAKEAERQKLAASEKAARDAIEAEKRHQQEIGAAAQAERDRIAELKRVEDEKAAARVSDKAHKAEINARALKCLITRGVSATAAKKAVTLIAQGKIDHVTISY